MLQEEGLVEAEPQKKARIIGFDPAHLESVYVQRILIESLAARLSADRATDDLLSKLDVLIVEMHERRSRGSDDEWQVLHRRFHATLVRGPIGGQLEQAIQGHLERSERYRVLYPIARSGQVGEREHRAIVSAYRARDGEGAAGHLTAHLARTALALIANLKPSYDPMTLRGAIDLAANTNPPGKNV